MDSEEAQSNPNADLVVENDDSEVSVLAEVVENYTSYETAVKAATNWIIYNKSKPGPHDKPLPIKLEFPFQLYPSKANKPPGINGKIVGIGIKKTITSRPIDLIRLDYDPTKGFHFNVFGLNRERTWRDDAKKLAATFPVQTTDPDAKLLELVQPLQLTTAERLWDAWKNGRQP
ncbi:hypothetical protein E1B28_001676 [Marasmius oreades]|uniref:Uncharacterized protein n=1 Tax=Marasmius oreades TaxID=181124 RepID=A0A9P7V413_9AGAR|nr:uncharacterized protein E1B28_001676 [Marasmius oreades]KAG7099873.1 hypothetical protein E1B28_001676 [Marasmius oreades]